MKTNILIITIVASILVNGCHSGRKAPASNRSWDYAPENSELERMHGLPTQTTYVPELEPQTQPQPQSQPRIEQNKAGNVVTRTYPCGDCGVMRLVRWAPAQVPRNAPFMYTIKVTNLTHGVVDDVVVREKMSDYFKVMGSSPQAQAVDQTLVWHLGSIAADSSKEITVQGTATADQTMQQCATMTYVVPACVNVDVVHTELLVAKVMLEEALLCDTIGMNIGVKNIGNGMAENVVIHDDLPPGLTSVGGERELRFNVGDLGPGQSKKYSVDLKADRVGVFENVAKATSANGAWVESAPARVTVRQPVLAISKIGPADRYMGRTIDYQITVTNRGNAPAQNLVVADTIPTGLSFVNADNGGAVSNNRVVWNLPPLLPNQSQAVNVTYMANEYGTFVGQAVAQAACAEPVQAGAQTRVSGIAAILLEVIDIDDPIEVGGIETYLITTTNQGTSDGTNVRIVCTLEDNMEYAASEGPTQATVQGQTITFAPLLRLPPKAQATWKVAVKAVKPDDARFQVTLNTDQLGRPVRETESTHIYE